MPIDAPDLDADCRLTRVTVERLFAAARASYFALCATIDPSMLTVTSITTVIGVPVEGATVAISTGAVELYPKELAFEARLRSGAGGETAARSRCLLSVASGVTKAQRDELVALAHGARYLH